MRFLFMRTIATAGVLAVYIAPVWALSSVASQKEGTVQLAVNNPVVALVNGSEIRLSDVESARVTLPAKYRTAPLKIIFPKLLPGLVNAQLAAEAARAERIDELEPVRQRFASEKRRILAGAFFDQNAAKQITQKTLREEYDRFTASEGDREEGRVRHILLRTEDEAKAVIIDLEDGADFADLARKKSRGPSAAKGGDLGFFEHGRMVKPFADAAFSLEKGQFTREPVRTRFGWHVIKLEEKRRIPTPSFEKTRPRLIARLRDKAAGELLAALKKDAKIEMFNLDGSPRKAPHSKDPRDSHVSEGGVR